MAGQEVPVTRKPLETQPVSHPPNQTLAALKAETKPKFHSQPLTAIEMAHVLSIDIVGYSKLPMDQQTRQLRRLQKIVGDTMEFRSAQKKDQLISLPAGDGVTLVFFHDPVAPVRSAFEIARATQSHTEIKLRMGIHSGPAYRIADINTNQSVSGEAINTVQGIMNYGDEGHILLSKSVADVLSQLGDWAGHMHACGDCEIRPGTRIDLFNLYTNEIGNPAMPERLCANSSTAAPIAAPAVATRKAKLRLVIALGALIIAGAITAYFTLFKSDPRPLSTAEFHDEFINLDRWIKPVSGSGWALINEHLELNDQPEIIWARDVYVEDFTMQFHLKLINDAGAAWALRAQDPKNYYLFYLSGPTGLSPNKLITYIVRDGKRSRIGAIAITPHLEANGEYRIEIKARKNEFIHRIRVNFMAGEFADKELGLVFNLAHDIEQTNAFARGSIGFLTVDKERFQIDDLYVWPPEIKPVEAEMPQ